VELVPTAISLEATASDGYVASEPRVPPRTATRAQSEPEAIYWTEDSNHKFIQTTALEQMDSSADMALASVSERNCEDHLSAFVASVALLRTRRGMSLRVARHIVALVDLNLLGANRWVVAQ